MPPAEDECSKKLNLDKRKVFTSGKTVSLVALDYDDIESSDWVGWFNDEETTKNTQQHRFPVSRTTQRQHLDNELRSENLNLGIFSLRTEALVGVTSIKDIDWINRSAEISTVVGCSAHRDLTTFIEVTRLMLVHGFFSLNLNRIQVGTMIKELVKIQCDIFGFVHEGTLREHVFKDGEYRDVYILGCLKDEFRKKSKVS